MQLSVSETVDITPAGNVDVSKIFLDSTGRFSGHLST